MREICRLFLDWRQEVTLFTGDACTASFWRQCPIHWDQMLLDGLVMSFCTLYQLSSFGVPLFLIISEIYGLPKMPPSKNYICLAASILMPLLHMWIVCFISSDMFFQRKKTDKVYISLSSV